MSDHNAKDLRKQLKNVIQGMKDEMIGNELVVAMEKRLSAIIVARLNLIDARMKDIQSFMVRQNMAPVVHEPSVPESKQEAPAAEVASSENKPE